MIRARQALFTFSFAVSSLGSHAVAQDDPASQQPASTSGGTVVDATVEDPLVAARLDSLGDGGMQSKLAATIRAWRKALPAPKIAKPTFPPLFLRLLESRDPELETILDVVGPVAKTPEVLTRQVEEVVMGIFGAAPRGLTKPKALDIDGFRAAAEKAMRGIRSGIDTGESYDQLVSEVQRSLEQLRELENADDLTPERKEELGGVFHKMALANLVPLLEAAFPLLDASASMARPEFVAAMRRKEIGKVPSDDRAYVTGDILAYGQAGFGKFVVGGFGDNTYDCTRFAVIVDFGGNDTYNGPAGGTIVRNRRLGVVVDVAGNDKYVALNDGLGSASYGIGMLIDHAGDDFYTGNARCAGFGAAGIGILVDRAGNDTYDFDRHSGGVGVGGVGIFADLQGDDASRAGTQSFGLGLPAGVGVYVDGAGDDVVVVGQESGAPARSLAMGTGVGLGGLVAGGVGMFLDRSGDDQRVSGGLSFGAAAHGGLGVFVDFHGADVAHGGPGSLGASYGKGIGVFVDARGDDQFAVKGGMGLGASADGRAWFLDPAGDDRYSLEGVGFGRGLATGVAGFFDLAGADQYELIKESLFPSVWRAGAKAEGTWQVFLDEGEGEDVFGWDVPDGRKPVAGKTITVDGDRLLVDTHPAKAGNAASKEGERGKDGEDGKDGADDGKDGEH